MSAGQDPWSDSAMAATVAESLGVGQDSELPPDIRFLASSVKLVGRRLRRPESRDDPRHFAVFVLKPMGRRDPAVEDFELVWRLDEATTALSGRLWLTNEALNFGHALAQVPAESELISWLIDDLELGEYPTVIYDPTVDGGRIRFYPDGLADLGKVETYGVGDLHAVSADDVKGIVDFVVSHSLLTPQMQISKGSTWVNPSKYWVASNAEALIQGQLRVALKARWPICDIQHEIPVRSGRFDLSVSFFDPDSTTWTHYGVLELKVLKDRSATGKTSYGLPHNQAVVADGVAQAASYRDNIGATWGMLCCFDHRQHADDECLATLASNDSRDVEVHRWRIWNSSEPLRA